MSSPTTDSAAKLTPPAAQPVVQVRGLSLAFAAAGAGRPAAPPLFTDLSLELHAGVTLLAGDMGGGKTTLLRLLAGEIGPTSGEIRLAGRRLGADPAADRREICWFDPRDEAFDALTPAGLYAALRQRHPGPAQLSDPADIEAWQADGDAEWQAHVDGLDLTPHLAKPLYALSTGSRRKAGLAAALACRGPLTLLDDPTAGLDRPALAWLAEVLATLAEEAAEAAALSGPAACAAQAPRALVLVSDPALQGLAGVRTLSLPARD
ncbi:MAG: hypothetical protein RIQ60_3881 [Pseudomonadota bacterium]|jgi:ABC-type multidrug transport system ATPase subunit